MVDEALSKGGLYLDDLTKRLRILDPEYHQLTQDLITECEEYLTSLKEFEGNAGEFIQILNGIAEGTSRERMEVVGKRSRLLSVETERRAATQRIHALLLEKKAELERVTLLHEMLRRVLIEQEETLLKLTKK